MEREARFITARIAGGEALSGVIDTTWAAGLGLKTPEALEANTKIAFQVSETKDGAFLPLYDETNSLVEMTVQVDAARAYEMPDELFAWRYIKLWTESSGSDVVQSTERLFSLVLKS